MYCSDSAWPQFESHHPLLIIFEIMVLCFIPHLRQGMYYTIPWRVITGLEDTADTVDTDVIEWSAVLSKLRRPSLSSQLTNFSHAVTGDYTGSNPVRPCEVISIH